MNTHVSTSMYDYYRLSEYHAIDAKYRNSRTNSNNRW